MQQNQNVEIATEPTELEQQLRDCEIIDGVPDFINLDRIKAYQEKAKKCNGLKGTNGFANFRMDNKTEFQQICEISVEIIPEDNESKIFCNFCGRTNHCNSQWVVFLPNLNLFGTIGLNCASQRNRDRAQTNHREREAKENRKIAIETNLHRLIDFTIKLKFLRKEIQDITNFRKLLNSESHGITNEIKKNRKQDFIYLKDKKFKIYGSDFLIKKAYTLNNMDLIIREIEELHIFKAFIEVRNGVISRHSLSNIFTDNSRIVTKHALASIKNTDAIIRYDYETIIQKSKEYKKLIKFVESSNQFLSIGNIQTICEIFKHSGEDFQLPPSFNTEKRMISFRIRGALPERIQVPHQSLMNFPDFPL